MKQDQKQGETKRDEKDGRGSTSRHRSKRSRSRSSRKRKSHRHRHGSKDKHKHRHKKRSGSKSSEKESDTSEGRKKKKENAEEEVVMDPVKRQEEAMKKQIIEAKRQAEEAQRDDCTVLVSRIHINANERDVYNFFSNAGVGKIRDVRLIRDQRSGKSKGISYVEFYTPESVLLTMALSGTQLMGQTLMIQASQAEKNRAAAASKFKKEQSDRGGGPPKPEKKSEENNRVYVGGLTDVLNNVTESEIRQWFNPFGEIESIELPKDHITGKNKGHAIIEFKKHRDAKTAVKEMNSFDINGKKLKVSILTESLDKQMTKGADHDLLEDSANSYIHSAQSRALLMQKLSRDSGQTQDNGQAIMSQNFNNQPAVPQFVQTMPTNCLLLNNMFDPIAVDLKRDPAYFIDIKEQVTDVCSEMGKVEKVWIEQNSPGNVWVKFHKDHVQGAIKAHQTLNNRFFDSRLITANFVPETVFNSKVKER